MPYKLEVAKDADMPEVIAVVWDTFEHPYQGILRNFFPILNNDREASLKASIEGQREEYKASYPELVWLKVTYYPDGEENAKGQIVGSAKWYFFQRNPFVPLPGSDHDPMTEEAVWYPEGVGRTFATAAMHALDAPRMRMAQRPHAFLNIAATVLEHRGKGVGGLFLRWGLARADELGLDIWLDASDFGKPVYEKLGFIAYGLNKVSPVMPSHYTAEQQAEWEQYEKEILPMNTITMWRPARGVYIAGETTTPWDN